MKNKSASTLIIGFIVLIFLLLAISLFKSNKEDTKSSTSWSVHTVCGLNNNIKGIDVSYWQRNINWHVVKDEGIVFGFARVSDGLEKIDPKFEQNWHGMKEAKLIRGAYQFFRPNQDALKQAQLFVDILNSVGGLEEDDMPPVIDLEVTGTVTSNKIIEGAMIWVDYVQLNTNKKPIIYTGPAFWDSHFLGPGFSTYPLWIAHYTSKECPWIPDGWSKWAFWQFTGSGNIKGVPTIVDINVFDGTIDGLRTFVKKHNIPHDSGIQDVHEVDMDGLLNKESILDSRVDIVDSSVLDSGVLEKPTPTMLDVGSNNRSQGCSYSISSNKSLALSALDIIMNILFVVACVFVIVSWFIFFITGKSSKE